MPDHADLPCDPDAPIVCLVVKGSPEALVFEHAEELAESKGFVPLTLKGMEAKALVNQAPQPAEIFLAGRKVIGVGVGSADIAVRARLDDRKKKKGFLTCEDTNSIFLLQGDPESGSGMIRKGNSLFMSYETMEDKSKHQFKVNLDDGTISPVHKTGIADAELHGWKPEDPDLVFGLKV